MLNARPKIGLVLGSGGARGWAHMGVIQALLELGIRPDLIVGTSIGALIGAIYAAGAFEVFQSDLEHFGWAKLAKLFAEVHLPRAGFHSGRPIMEWLDSQMLLNRKTFLDLSIPFAAIATNLFTETAVTISTGSVAEAVRASISIPGVFDPVVLNGDVLVDGGLSDPVPTAVARKLGADIVIAVDINSLPHQHAITTQPTFTTPPNVLVTLTQSLRIIETKLSKLSITQDPADVLILPDTGSIQTLDFYHGKDLVQSGKVAVYAMRDQLLKVLS